MEDRCQQTENNGARAWWPSQRYLPSSDERRPHKFQEMSTTDCVILVQKGNKSRNRLVKI